MSKTEVSEEIARRKKCCVAMFNFANECLTKLHQGLDFHMNELKKFCDEDQCKKEKQCKKIDAIVDAILFDEQLGATLNTEGEQKLVKKERLANVFEKMVRLYKIKPEKKHQIDAYLESLENIISGNENTKREKIFFEEKDRWRKVDEQKHLYQAMEDFIQAFSEI